MVNNTVQKQNKINEGGTKMGTCTYLIMSGRQTKLCLLLRVFYGIFLLFSKI